MLKEMQKRQVTYFTYQQNKFMRTTNVEGGMKEENGESIRQNELRAAFLCPCFYDCFKTQGDDAQPDNLNRSVANTRDASIVEE